MAGKRRGVVAAVCLAAVASWPGAAGSAVVDGEHDLTAAGVHFRLQFPPSIEHTISTSTSTPEVYGRIRVPGVTNESGHDAELLAQVGYGPDGSDPAVTSSWRWEAMSFNLAYVSGSPGYEADTYEYSGTMLPDTVGIFDYTTRWSGDGGASWHYTDLDGQEDGVEPAEFGQMTVNPSEDLDAPAAPALELGDVGPESVSLSWSQPPGGDIAGYELFRDGSFLVRLTDTAHTDTVDLVAGQTYSYSVLAYDTSFNRSPASNPVSATPDHPPATVPTVTVADPTAREHTGLPFRVSWESTAAASYDIQWAAQTSTPDGWRLGPWQLLTGGTEATSAVFGEAGSPVTPGEGRTYAFRARASNAGGAPTPWSPVARASVPLDDRARPITWSSGWTKSTRPGRFLDTLRSSGRAGATATLQAQARGFTVMGDRCPACGRLRVLERTGNGRWVLVRTVDTQAPTREVRQVLYAGNADRKVTSRSVRVEVVGTKGRPTVVLDAIAVRR